MLSITNHQKKKFKSKPTENNKCWWRWEIEILMHCWWDCKMLMNTMEKQYVYKHLKKLNKITIWFHFRVNAQKNWKQGLKRYLYTHVIAALSTIATVVRTHQESNQGRMGKIMVYTYSGILLSLKKEGNPVTYYNMNEPWGRYAKGKNLVAKSNTTWFYLWCT